MTQPSASLTAATTLLSDAVGCGLAGDLPGALLHAVAATDLLIELDEREPTEDAEPAFLLSKLFPSPKFDERGKAQAHGRGTAVRVSPEVYDLARAHAESHGTTIRAAMDDLVTLPDKPKPPTLGFGAFESFTGDPPEPAR